MFSMGSWKATTTIDRKPDYKADEDIRRRNGRTEEEAEEYRWCLTRSLIL